MGAQRQRNRASRPALRVTPGSEFSSLIYWACLADRTLRLQPEVERSVEARFAENPPPAWALSRNGEARLPTSGASRPVELGGNR